MGGIERLRGWLLVGAGVLLAVLAGFVAYSHYAARRLLRDLPGRLGAEITRETNGFTYSQSSGKRTLYTIHASKAVQRKDGRVLLEDVGVVLYERTGDRADRIYGREFEYDGKAGILRARGTVYLDLQAPAPADAKARSGFAAGISGKRGVVHVTTSGVVFLQKAGLVSTDQPIEFRYDGLTGHAVGASYNSDSAVTVLESQVRVKGERGGRPVDLTADRAELDRTSNRLLLERANYSTEPPEGEPQTYSAQHTVVLLDDSGAPRRIEAEGSVKLEGANGAVSAPRGTMTLGERAQPRAAHLSGGVLYAAKDTARQTEGAAATADANFTPAGELRQVLLGGGVRLEDGGAVATGRRSLTAEHVMLAFVTDGAGGRQWVREARATGDAALLSTAPAPPAGTAPRPLSSELRADTLVAQLSLAGKQEQITALEGEGHTSLHRVSSDGAELRSTGEHLQASFAEPTGAGDSSVVSNVTLRSAVQQGEVHLEQNTPATAKSPSGTTHASASRAALDGATHVLALSGAVQLSQPEGLLWAETVTLHQGSGDAEASGSVKASYRAKTEAAPVAILAAQAELRRGSRQATFFGSPGKLARMWQGGSSIEAPVIALNEAARTLAAHGLGAAEALPVRAVLANAETNAAPGKRAGVVRVSSQALLYRDLTHTAQFTGGVVMEQAGATLRGEEATAYLAGKTPSGAAPVSGAPPFLSGSLERVVARGEIHIDQGGRHATAQEAVYTAADGLFTLSGSPGHLPEMASEGQGSVSGAVIRFHPGDNSVTVSRGAGAEQVRTETRVRPR